MPAPKIMIIRHAEKPTTSPPAAGVTVSGTPDPDSLIVRGWQRAGALVPFFIPASGLPQRPGIATPQFLYATETDDVNGNRPQETIAPLAAKLGLTPTLILKTPVKPGWAYEELISSAMRSDGIVLICWPHGEIPSLTWFIPLSVNNKNPIQGDWSWPSDRFDVVFVFDLDTSPGGSGYLFTQVPQLLLDLDSSAPIQTNGQ